MPGYRFELSLGSDSLRSISILFFNNSPNVLDEPKKYRHLKWNYILFGHFFSSNIFPTMALMLFLHHVLKSYHVHAWSFFRMKQAFDEHSTYWTSMNKVKRGGFEPKASPRVHTISRIHLDIQVNHKHNPWNVFMFFKSADRQGGRPDSCISYWKT